MGGFFRTVQPLFYRNDFIQVETYVQQRSEATFSHSICPECARTLYPDLNIDLKDLEPEDPS